jgi:hypothetical protein
MVSKEQSNAAGRSPTRPSPAARTRVLGGAGWLAWPTALAGGGPAPRSLSRGGFSRTTLERSGPAPSCLMMANHEARSSGIETGRGL